jgi:CheY-like chemotaxis protein
MAKTKWISDIETTILMVDDDESNRELVSTVLDLCGYTSWQAADGIEALQVLADHPVDLILLDIMMPDMDGYDFCRKLKDSNNLGHIPIIMLTALADAISREKAFEAGADDFLSKPFKMDELISRIENLSKSN